MVSNMNQIAQRVYQLAEEKWGWVLEAIDGKLKESEQDELHSEVDLDDCTDDEMGDETLKNNCHTKTPSHPLQKIYGDMDTYMSQMPVLGFNSAKYDLNLIKRVLAKHLNMHEETGAFVIKKNNAYTCIATESLKFLDMSQFLAAGSSYTSFLKAYHVAEQKRYFPYEWFDDIAKLEYEFLPPHQAFPLFVLIVFCLFVIFIYFPLGFKSGICLLIAPVPVHCFSITFVLQPVERQ